ncbi:hypothetical protein I302_101473 [Kwoniella bestiolae CBS 10118]|uniref:F-box domain-containing protein n=1 Tax=Kwoniella bestiolae CBS 10118 TaxID=1296100 RepID=A0A1B9GCB2_9TREE|nr:hypothetical protein I302_00156 [Kwoniella bestiolae CBS 10118]OCF28667.1 hypothetical protein I302_00156 [Kwoniella bestiolae CBS 10118]
MPRKLKTIASSVSSPYHPSCASIEILPLELKLRVVSYLSLSDAHNLACSSRSLQNAAESLIWSKVDMTLPVDWDKRILLWEESMPDWWEVEELSPEIQDILVNFKSTMDMEGGSIGTRSQQKDDICWNLRALKFLTRTKQVYRALKNLPSRSQWVKELRIECRPPRVSKLGDLLELIEVIKLVRESIGTLRIGTPDISSREGSRELMDVNDYLKRLELTSPHLSRLHTLEFNLNKMPPEIEIANVLSTVGVSNTQHLILNPRWTSCARADSPMAKQIPSLPSLQTIRANQIHPMSIPTICRLVKAAENLEGIIVDWRDAGYTWGYSSDLLAEAEMKMLQEHKGLRRIEWHGGIQARWWFEKICQSGFDAVEILVESQAIECESETFIENIFMPPFPALKTILIPCRTPKWYRHLSPPDWAKAPPPRNSISPHVISHLRDAPNLLAVQFSCLSTLTIEEVSDSVQWCDKRVNGVLIRSYLNEVTGEEFYHLRRLELLTVQPKIYDSTYKGQYECMKKCQGNEVDHRWVDHLSYKNAMVPPPILKKVYKCSGEKSGWQIPGRGLALPESAWVVLRNWRVKLPDKGIEGRKIVTRRMARDLQ